MKLNYKQRTHFTKGIARQASTPSQIENSQMKLNYTATPRIVDDFILLIDEEQYVEDSLGRSTLDSISRSYATLVADTREKAIREGLIALGWTPPPGET